MRLSLLAVLACLILAPAALILSALALPAFSGFSTPAYAGPEKAATEPAAPAQENKATKPASDPKKATPLDTLRDYTLEMIEGMSQKQLQYVYVIRTRHGIIRAVEVVRRDVGKAVKLCAKAHADMKDPLEARYQRWTDNVNPILEDAQGLLERDIVNQTFTPQAKIRKLLDLTTKAGDYTESQVTKEIVTTKDACEFLLKNMDMTQKDLPDLLRASLKNLPVPDPDAPDAPPPKVPEPNE